MILQTWRHLLHSAKPTAPLWTGTNGTERNRSREGASEHKHALKWSEKVSLMQCFCRSHDICGFITSIPFHSFLEVTHIHLSRTKVEEWINTTSQTKSFLVNVLELSVLNTNIPWQHGEGGGDRISQTYKIVPWNFRLNLQVQRFTLYDAVSRVYIF